MRVRGLMGGVVCLTAILAVAGVPALADNQAGIRLVEIPDSPGVVALWTDPGADGATHFYAVSLDGQTFSRAYPTTNQIQFRYAQFDPLADTPAVPAELQARAGSAVYVVQFVSQPLEAFQNALRDAGATIYAFVAENAVVAHMPPATHDAVSQMPFVRWVGVLHPVHKLDEVILDALAAGGPDSELQTYSVMVFGEGLDYQQPIVEYLLATGGEVMNVAPDGHRMTVWATLPQVLEIAHMEQVQFIDPWGPGEYDLDIVREIGGVATLHTLGFRGAGVRGEVFDGGVVAHQEWATKPVLHHGTAAGNSHGTACFGNNFSAGVVAQARGMNPDHEQGISCLYTQTTQFSGPRTRLSMNQEAVDPNGPYRSMYQTSSVGSPRTRQYTTISAETDDYLFKVDYLSFQSQSNASLNQDSRPQAWAKNIVSCGGITHLNTLTRADDYSSGSTGPASDNRIKPDLAHFYDQTYTTSTTSYTGYGNFSGTSNATPCTAGHAGLMMHMWHVGVFPGFGGGPSAFDDRPRSTTAKAMLINTAYKYNWKAGGSNANMWRDRQGWGMVDLGKLYAARDKMIIVNETDILTPFSVKTYNVNVPAGEPELAVTLVYIDPQGNPAVQTQHRINDLTLKVTSPGGIVYYGNNGLRDDNFSIPGGVPNTKDTVENVFIPNPQAGAWVVQVFGDEIVQDSHLATPELDAAYGLVIRGVLRGLKGDVNCDGQVNFADINPFVLLLTNPAGWQAQYPNCPMSNGDINNDGIVDFQDINPFVSLLVGP